MNQKRVVGLTALIAMLMSVVGCSNSIPDASATTNKIWVSPTEAREIGTIAYIYGYPLVTMEYTRRVSTNVAAPSGAKAPMGQFARLREYPPPDVHTVTAPNADTLYTIVWLDLAREPWVLSLPDMHDRYYLMPMLSGWTNVFEVPGKRTTGTDAQTYVITGPNWTGTVPEGMTQYKSPTNMVWVLGRIYCTGTPEDYSMVHQLQDECAVVPLSSYGKPYTPPMGKVDTSIDMKTAVRDQVNALSADEYFALLARLMRENPPAAEDAPMVAKLARLGIAPGKRFDMNRLSPDARAALRSVPKSAVEQITTFFQKAGRHENGWTFTTKTGEYGTGYLNRAMITAIGLGANRPQDAVYPTSETDADGNPYTGSNRYVMHFEPGKMPPVNAFWSLTMYDDQFFFYPNPLDRYTLSSRDALEPNPDGSVDLYLQHESPGPGKESNWLPTPAGRFILMLRLYWPKESPPSIIDGTWKIPAVKKVAG